MSQQDSAPTVLPTTWNGYQFRSRTEARWGVFLSTLPVRFEYEHETYKLENGTCYLPDFWIPVWQLFIEVKGRPPSHEERGKAAMLAKITKTTVMFGVGAPSERMQETISLADNWPPGWHHSRIEQCRRCHGYALVGYDVGHSPYTALLGKHEYDCDDRWPIGVPQPALMAARAEQFGVYPTRG